MLSNPTTKTLIQKTGFFISCLALCGLLLIGLNFIPSMISDTIKLFLVGGLVVVAVLLGLLIFKWNLYERLQTSISKIEKAACSIFTIAVLTAYGFGLSFIPKVISVVVPSVEISKAIMSSPGFLIPFIILSIISIYALYYIVKEIYAKLVGIDTVIDKQKSEGNSKISKLFSGISPIHVGVTILLFMFYTILVSTIGFIFNISILPAYFVIGIILTGVTVHFLITKNLKKTLLVFLLFLVILSLCIGVSGALYDSTWDGEAYHKTAVGLLDLGWNPIYESTNQAIDRLDVASIIPSGSIISDVYAKASWIFAAAADSLFGNIETGKCCTILSIIALFCIVYSFLREKTNLTTLQAVICSFFLAVNPVTVCQMFTYYNDAFLGVLIFVYISSFLYLSYGEQHLYHLISYILIFTSACVGMNVKFSGLLFFGLFGALFYFYWILRRVRKDGLKNSGKFILKLSCFFVILVTCSCVLFGSTVYIPNTITYENPLYGLIGDTNLAGIDVQSPAIIQNLPTELRFIVSIFSASANSKTIDYLPLKLPFTFSVDEMAATVGSDCRLGGWGMMFSGLFVIGLICIVLALFCTWKRDWNAFTLITLITVSILLSGTFITGMWWARYNILPYLISIFPFILLFIILNRISQKSISSGNHIKKELLRICTVLFVILLIVASLFNIAPAALGILQNIPVSVNADNTFETLKNMPDDIVLEVSTVSSSGYTFNGRLFNLYDNDISYQINQALSQPDGMIFRKYPISYKFV